MINDCRDSPGQSEDYCSIDTGPPFLVIFHGTSGPRKVLIDGLCSTNLFRHLTNLMCADNRAYIALLLSMLSLNNGAKCLVLFLHARMGWDVSFYVIYRNERILLYFLSVVRRQCVMILLLWVALSWFPAPPKGIWESSLITAAAAYYQSVNQSCCKCM